MRSDENGFSAVEILLVLVAIVLIGVAGWLVWRRNNEESSQKNQVHSGESSAVSESNQDATATLEQGVKLQPTIKQGVAGTILLRSGNCQPSDQEMDTRCEGEPYDVTTDVIIRKPTALSDATKGNLVKKASNVHGTFEIELEAGTYSLFVLHNGQEYCNSFDGEGRACVFDVKPNKVTTYTTIINEAVD